MSGDGTMHFGLSLAKIRTSLGMSQAELAASAGIAQSTVSDIENMRSDPKISTALKLMRGLDVQILEIVPNGGGYELRPWFGTPQCNEETFGEMADCLAGIRGWAQLAEESLRRHPEETYRRLASPMATIIAEVDRLTALINLFRNAR
ncbi:MAG: helix-turn-helix domain-containing protein [Bacillota bacterium]|nr:helix-turn-helix domain-containing protein [Bacillota bacterium]